MSTERALELNSVAVVANCRFVVSPVYFFPMNFVESYLESVKRGRSPLSEELRIPLGRERSLRTSHVFHLINVPERMKKRYRNARE